MKTAFITIVAVLSLSSAFSQSSTFNYLNVLDSLVSKSARINDLTVTGKSSFAALTVDGPVNFNNVPYITDPSNSSILFVDNTTGEQARINAVDVVRMFYGLDCFTDLSGNIPSPTWKNGTNKLYSPCPEVNVGIGTSSPTHKLHTVGNVLTTGTSQINGNAGIGSAPSHTSQLLITNANEAAALEINNTGNTTTNADLLLLKYTEPTTAIIKAVNSSTGTVPFQVNADGELIIDNGTRKILQLNSNGILQARRVLVDQDTWADYVFERDYKLMPLNEVRLYVNANKHLPNVPSENDVKEKGIDLAEMNTILLEKIEELTLYLIEQNDNTAELKAEIQALQARISQLEPKK